MPCDSGQRRGRECGDRAPPGAADGGGCLTPDGRMLILFLCTANTGRSALAGALLSRELADRHLLEVGVRSAGRLPGGQAVSPVVADVARAYRADLSAHRSTTVTPGLVGGADLVVAMAAEHAAHALAL